MSNSSLANLDELRRMQATLTKKGQQRDKENIRAVGFAPAKPITSLPSGLPSPPVTAQFDVHRKLSRVSEEKRIARLESLRLLDRATRQFQRVSLATDVVATGEVVPTGVSVSTGNDRATSSVVVRWTKVDPPPVAPSETQPHDPRWRWGVLSVSHLFAHSSQPSAPVQVERPQICDTGPPAIEGRVLARGRVPGGPDISLIETGLDRLWLSGFLPRVDAHAIATAQESQLMQWISQGTIGDFLGDGVHYRWIWTTFYPELAIEQLGVLQQIVRYELDPQERSTASFGPGSSGAVVVAGGIPIGLHVAAVRPHYRVGYAQTFAVSLNWLKVKIRASELAIVGVLSDR